MSIVTVLHSDFYTLQDAKKQAMTPEDHFICPFPWCYLPWFFLGEPTGPARCSWDLGAKDQSWVLSRAGFGKWCHCFHQTSHLWRRFVTGTPFGSYRTQGSKFRFYSDHQDTRLYFWKFSISIKNISGPWEYVLTCYVWFQGYIISEIFYLATAQGAQQSHSSASGRVA